LALKWCIINFRTREEILKFFYIVICVVILAVSSVSLASEADFEAQKAKFIKEMSVKHSFNQAYLRGLFKDIKPVVKVKKKIKKNAESKSTSWEKYKSYFIKKKKIRDGIKYRNKYIRPMLSAYKKYGTPSWLIAAIIGVESDYGVHKSKYNTLKSLATLAFSGGRRWKFFSGELEKFLLYTKKNKIDPKTVSGSYAGALGIPQFIPSSIFKFAVDHDRNGQIDLMNSHADAIGSVGNYFKKHGYKRGGHTAIKVRVRGNAYKRFLSSKMKKPTTSVWYMRKKGVYVPWKISGKEKGVLMKMDDEYWVFFHNFYVITRYNHSAKYALAVTILSHHIRNGLKR